MSARLYFLAILHDQQYWYTYRNIRSYITKHIVIFICHIIHSHQIHLHPYNHCQNIDKNFKQVIDNWYIILFLLTSRNFCSKINNILFSKLCCHIRSTTTGIEEAVFALQLSIINFVIYYRIAGKFGGSKVWRIYLF